MHYTVGTLYNSIAAIYSKDIRKLLSYVFHAFLATFVNTYISYIGTVGPHTM